MSTPARIAVALFALLGLCAVFGGAWAVTAIQDRAATEADRLDRQARDAAAQAAYDAWLLERADHAIAALDATDREMAKAMPRDVAARFADSVARARMVARHLECICGGPQGLMGRDAYRDMTERYRKAEPDPHVGGGFEAVRLLGDVEEAEISRATTSMRVSRSGEVVSFVTLPVRFILGDADVEARLVFGDDRWWIDDAKLVAITPRD